MMTRNTLALVVAVAILLSGAAYGADGIDTNIISFSAGPEIFPDAWKASPFFGKTEPADPPNQQRAAAAVMKAIKKYPEALIARTLKHVYIVGAMTFFNDTPYSGTASSSDVYLAVQRESKGYSARFIEARFHAEYSTLLLNLHLKNLDQAAWNKVNPPDFKYIGGNSWNMLHGRDGGAAAIANGKSSLLRAGPTDLESGFLTEYSKSSLENDFNEYAAAIYLDEPEFAELAAKYPGVAKKRDIAKQFYAATIKQVTSGK